MTGYQSKRAAAQDKLAQPAQEPSLQDQYAKAYSYLAETTRRKEFRTNKGLEDSCEAAAEVCRIQELLFYKRHGNAENNKGL